jgi:hypothetical protein
MRLRRASVLVAVCLAGTAALTPAAAGGLPPTGIEIGAPFPGLSLPRLEGGAVSSLGEFEGRPVVLHVFASW